MAGNANSSKHNGLAVSHWDFVLALAVFAFVLIVYRLLNWSVGYPNGSEWQLPVFLAFGLSALPFAVRLLLFIQDAGGSLDFGGVKISFPSVARPPSLAIRANLADNTASIRDSGSEQLETAAAMADKVSVAIIDLENGRAWYLTRLFAVAATSLQFNLDQQIVFLATLNGRRGQYVGYASASAVATAIMTAVRPPYLDFTKAYLGAISSLLAEAPQPLMALPYPDGRPPRLSAPALFMTRLAQSMEVWEHGPEIQLWFDHQQLETILGSRLRRSHIDIADDDKKKIDSALSNDGTHVALLKENEFVALLPITQVIQDILAGLLIPERRDTR